MSKRRGNSTGGVPIGQLLQGVLDDLRENADAGLLSLWEHWEEIVGPDVAANARPAAFKGKVLLVRVSSSPWMHQLYFVKKEMIANINAFLGGPAIEEIKFKIGNP